MQICRVTLYSPESFPRVLITKKKSAAILGMLWRPINRREMEFWKPVSLRKERPDRLFVRVKPWDGHVISSIRVNCPRRGECEASDGFWVRETWRWGTHVVDFGFVSFGELQFVTTTCRLWHPPTTLLCKFCLFTFNFIQSFRLLLSIPTFMRSFNHLSPSFLFLSLRFQTLHRSQTLHTAFG